MDQAIAARHSHEKLREAVGTDGDALYNALAAECTAAMLSLAGSAFALDALYESLNERAMLPVEIRQRWAKNKLKRSRRIGETVRLTLKPKFSNSEGKETTQQIDTLFRFRDWAVHPPANFIEPIQHPILGSGVEWRYIAYTFDNCRNALSFLLEYLRRVLKDPRVRDQDLTEWAASMETRLEGRRVRFLEQVADGSSSATDST